MAKENGDNNQYLGIASSVSGVIFLGTPHRGSDFAPLGILMALLSYWRGSRIELLEFLSPESSDIEDLHDTFLNMYPTLRICNFFETLPATFLDISLSPVSLPSIFLSLPSRIRDDSLISMAQVVRKQAATIPGKLNFSFRTDHQGLNKFSGEEDDGYQKTLVEISASIPPPKDTAVPSTAMLFRAIADDNCTKVEDFLERGLKVTAMKENLDTLMAAAQHGSAATARVLLQHGADPTTASPQGDTSLHFAAAAGQVLVLKLILDREEIDKNARNLKYQTALYHAAFAGHKDAVALLLRYGVTAESESLEANPVYTAAQEGHVEIVEAFVGYGPLQSFLGTAQAREIIMLCAVQSRSTKMLAFLLDRGVDINLRCGLPLPSQYHGPPLAHAVLANDIDMVEFLLSHEDIDANSTNGDEGTTPFHIAVRRGEISMIQLLLNCSKVDPNIADATGETALCQAFWMRDTTITELLVSCPRVDVNQPWGGGNLPLCSAARSEWPLELLLSRADLDVNATGEDGETALYKVVKDLRTRRILQSPFKTIKMIMGRKGINKNTVCNGRFSPLHLAAGCHPYEAQLLGALIDEWTDLETAESELGSPLVFAYETHCHRTMPILLERGANPNAQIEVKDPISNKMHKIPLLEHAARQSKGDVVRLLQRYIGLSGPVEAVDGSLI